MHLKDLCKEAHALAIEKGFWKKEECPKCHGSSVVKLIRAKILCPRCNNTGFIQERNNGELLMLICSELGEACEALRKDKRQSNAIYDYKDGKIIKNKKLAKTRWVKDTFEDEIADTFIRLADMCEAMKIDIQWQIKKKMEFNEDRPEKHGKRF